MIIALLACGGVPAEAGPAPVQAEVDEPARIPAKRTPSKKTTETLKTSDGVALEADLYLGEAGADGVVLLHMIPPHWDRTSWPTSFLDALAERGHHVCVPDRRGAGKSKGVAEEAYKGPKGKHDVDACVRRLGEAGLGKLAVFGASNGTTSMLDYTIWSRTEAAAPTPVLLGFLTGGKYTEAQHDAVNVEDIPAVFTYSTEERAWSAGLIGVSKKWVFHEYPGGEHGTKMFAAKSGFEPDLLRAIDKAFQ